MSGLDDHGPESIGNGRYLLSEKLGEGGQSEVYEALDTVLDVPRAIKIMVTSLPRHRLADLRKRLHAEARALARIVHPNIVRIYDIVNEDGRDYVVMELHRGGTLEDLRDKGTLTPRAAVGFVLQVLAGLAAAHEQGIIHRDVKPANVLVSADGVAKLADFGIAMLTHDESMRSTRTGVAMGTLAYMAPEQRIDARSVTVTADIHAVGAMLYELVTGENPFDLFVFEADDERFHAVPTPLRPIVVRSTRYRADSRYPTAVAMAADLMAILDDLESDSDDLHTGVTWNQPGPILPTGPSVAATQMAMTLLEDADPPAQVAQVVPDETAAEPKRRMGPISLVMGGVGAILLIGGVGWSVSRPAPPAAAELPASAVISPPVVPLAPIPGVEEIEEVVDPAPAQASALPPVPAAAVTEPEPELPSVVPDGAFPAGQWSGSFAGFNAEMQLSGEPAALDGDVTVAFAGGQPVRSRVTGTYDLDSGILTLDDVEDSPDAGTYSGKVDAERGRVSGTFESRGSNKTVVPFFFRRID